MRISNVATKRSYPRLHYYNFLVFEKVVTRWTHIETADAYIHITLR